MNDKRPILNGLTINPNNTYESDTHIFFWGSFMSNWAKSKFTHEGIEYTSSEQAMMAAKAKLFGDVGSLYDIMNTNDPAKQKAFGRKIVGYSEAIWSKKRYSIVVDILKSKFSQNEEFKKELLNTGNKIICESSSYDSVWGIAMHASNPDIHDESKWRGTNLLGKALMEVREKIKIEDGLV